MKNRTTLVKENMFGKVLDLGCNSGELHSTINNEDVYGLDRIVEHNDGRICKADAQYLPFKDKCFNTVIAGELIEHVVKISKFLQEIYRVLKRKGILILTTHNKNSWMNILFKFSFPVKKQDGLLQKTLNLDRQDINNYELRHRTLFEKQTLIILIKKHGYKIEKFLRLPHLEMHWLEKNYRFYKGRMWWHVVKEPFLQLRKIIHYLIPGAIQEEMFLCARKVGG